MSDPRGDDASADPAAPTGAGAQAADLGGAGKGLRSAAQVALVTGASGGIGAAICRALAPSVGALAIAYRDGAHAAESLAAEIEAAGTRACTFAADMADADAPVRLVDEVEQRLGPPAIMVAAHGIAKQVSYEQLDVDAFDRTVAINLRAPFLLAQRVLGSMREQRFGRILFISSTAALRGGMIGPDYAASKSGLHGLAHFLAARVAADGVTVNVLAPGYVQTAMLPGDPAELGARVPAGRVGQPDEIADFAVAILRNGFLTSKVLTIDGGIHPR